MMQDIDGGVQRLGNPYAWASFSNESSDHTKCAYRYELGRVWAASRGIACFLMLNPSTADHEKSDLTITKCTGFAERWGLGVLIVNLFAYRSTDPKALLDAGVLDPVGPHNDIILALAIRNMVATENGHVFDRSWPSSMLDPYSFMGLIPPIKRFVAAWGSLPGKDARLLERVRAVDTGSPSWLCLGITSKGDPRHPSRLGYDARLRNLRETRAEQPKFSVVK